MTELLVKFFGGACFGFLAAQLIRPHRQKLGAFADIVAITLAMFITILWIWVLQ